MSCEEITPGQIHALNRICHEDLLFLPLLVCLMPNWNVRLLLHIGGWRYQLWRTYDAGFLPLHKRMDPTISLHQWQMLSNSLNTSRPQVPLIMIHEEFFLHPTPEGLCI